jgi:hypothetical protein
MINNEEAGSRKETKSVKKLGEGINVSALIASL